MPTKKRNFTEEFREEAVRLALTSDLHGNTSNWVRIIYCRDQLVHHILRSAFLLR